MNFTKVPDPFRVPANYTMGAKILAVLEVHGGLQKDEHGVATVTIRKLLKKFVPNCTGMLAEYVCAFGAHGKAVISRYFEREGISKEDLDAKVHEFYLQFQGELWGQDLNKL